MDDESVILELMDDESSPLADDRRGVAEETQEYSGQDAEAIFISTEEIRNWDLRLILSSPVVRIRANRERLIHQSSYFRGLLGGHFSESSYNIVSIRWKREAVIKVLQFIFCCPLDLAADNFLDVLEGALFFGIDTLLAECEDWFRCKTTGIGTSSLQTSLDAVIKIWKFASEHAIRCIQELCEGYLARNFTWAVSCCSFPLIPYDFLFSSIQNPLLTVESEKQLCGALLVWLSNNYNSGQLSLSNSGDCYPEILRKVRSNLLPLDFVAENRGNPFFAKLAEESISFFFNCIKDSSVNFLCNFKDDGFENFHIRLTEISQRIDLSGCLQIDTTFLLLTVLPSSVHANSSMEKGEKHFPAESGYVNENQFMMSPDSLATLSFEAVCELDISRCRRLHLDNFIKYFYMSFPSLQVLKATHCLQFKMSTLCLLVQKFPLLNELDLTVDISPVVARQATVLSSGTERYQNSGDGPHVCKGSHLFTRIAKLSLEGRTDIDDMDLQTIMTISGLLSHLNLKGCSSVTDEGLSNLICQCHNLCCLVVSYTLFGRNSILVLCSDLNIQWPPHQQHEVSSTLAFRLQELDISGCKNVDQSSLFHLLHCTYMMKNLSLKDTCSMDDMLFAIRGSSLERFDVSDTMVSGASLAYIIQRNPSLKFLKARGCRNLYLCGSNLDEGAFPTESLLHLGQCDRDKLYYELGRKCILEEIAFGWGFSPFSLELLRPSIQTLRSITVGVGASLGESALTMLPELCPLLEVVVLHFQVISDCAMRSIMGSLKNLQMLGLCHCLGDVTSLSFQIRMPKLKMLKLARVTPWMTNDDLAILARSCPNLHELSLSGCMLLDSDSQQIISSGWPGLRSIDLEVCHNHILNHKFLGTLLPLWIYLDCGRVTSNGVSALLDCKAVDNLSLRHNGRGITRDFIIDAASKMPLLRTVSLDLCDASDGGFNSPNSENRFFLCTAKIARCKVPECSFELQSLASERRKLHKETIVLEWKSRELRTTIAKERL